MKMYNNYKDLLNTLKKRYEFNEVSALIGAGFSKNLYSNFPNWEELLRDMIIEIFSIEIDDAYSQLRHTKQYCKHIESKSSFTAKYVTNIINRYGYLDIVSMYIDKMGYRECIDLYIEKHIPYLDLSTNQLIFKGHTVEIKQEDTKVHEALLSLNKLNNIFTTNYDNIIEEVAKSSKDNTWVKICSSYDLKLSSLFKPIVKVHGDIRKKDDYNFHFDGDHNIQYVISKQDYEDYPRKHEAFMQLMRLSLLRETFMLFGFSGDDPNFVAWVKWVRDILVKNKDQDSEISTSEYYKIYLFAVDDKEPADDKIQYYINNHIIYIPILNSKILSLIGLPEDCKDVQKVIIKIFEYLSHDYNKLWSNVASIINQSANDNLSEFYISNYKVDNSILTRIVDEKANHRFVDSIGHQQIYLSKSTRSKITEDSANLLVAALHDSKLPISYYRLDEKIDSALKEGEAKTKFRLLQQRFTCLTTNYKDGSTACITNVDWESDYNNILSAAFSLDFSLIKNLLNSWSPSGIWVQNKASLYALFDDAIALDLLHNYIQEERNLQEQANAKYITYCYKRDFFSRYPIKKIEKLGLIPLPKIIETILTRICGKNDSPTPYGANIRTITHFGGNDDSQFVSCLRILQILLDSGMPPAYRRFIHVSKNKWFAVARELFEIYPYPILWYTLYYNDKNMLIRIGQEYAYSDNLKDEVGGIMNRLFYAYFDLQTPSFIKSSILQIITPFFEIISVDKWEDSFVKIWDSLYGDTHLENNEIKIEQSDFISKAIPYIKKERLMNKVVEDCLNMVDIDNNTNVINLLGALHKNMNCDATSIITNKIDNIIALQFDQYYYAILHNLSKKLSTSQIDKINDSIIPFITNNASVDYRVFESLSFFAYKVKDDKGTINCIKSAIIKHDKLWGNGIKGENGSDPCYIDIDGANIIKLKWNNTEVLSIINKLIDSYNQLKPVIYKITHQNRSAIFKDDYIILLSKMYGFCKQYNVEALYNGNITNQYTYDIYADLISLRGYVNLKDGLMSSEFTIVDSANDELISLLNKGWDSSYVEYIDILIDRVLFRQVCLLSSHLQGISYLLDKYYSEIINQNNIFKLNSILQLYADMDWKEVDIKKPEAYGYLVSIANILKNHGEQNEHIEHWLSLKGRFIYKCDNEEEDN